ncbi:threonine aldolase family protein [Halobellus clavatus]|uniref:L-threonine aldolase n=1 Tax=Halobellus clavatus TaxID=660517 RepID=A0A1H3GA42_9EURY|nr:GntG family PLP-dependent aldolase [Halobellus clavatus]SDY00203.1 L-threonine aldolase [Halobellus clavatus]
MAIDLRSDTVTRPSTAMREAAADADVGDDVYGEDPAVNDLEAAAAAAVGFEDALYVPTGTMGNQIAAHVHGERGEEVVLDRESHIYRWELGGLAQLSGLQPRTVDADNAVPTPAQFESTYVDESLHRPGTGLLTLENTHNARGGVATPPEALSAVADAAHDRHVPVHLDGARLFNACVALDVDPERMTSEVDSVLFCLSKGLGAPVGSILAGDADFIDAARRDRKLFGGGMRQAGLIAAPGLLALENVERLGVDHANAARLAAGLREIDGLRVPEPDTNIVQVDTADLGIDAETFVAECEDAGVRGGAHGDYVTRFCTHLDVDSEDIDDAIDRIDAVVESG